ncbi:MAG TPA: c-type cytochrome domain-containing protein [Opitutaceae bacterium]|nr:c-type cytochrome domain-containing protein [Opitutaceae bacterium]
MPESEKPSAKRWAWLGPAFLVYAAVVVLADRLPPDGRAHGSLAQFLGRFHPLVVHLPIGLVLLVPVLELAGAWGRRAELRGAAALVLALAALTALAAAGDGWLLAWSGAYSGPLVERHLRGGLIFAGLCLAALAARGWARPGAAALPYALLLAASVAAMVWTSHQGGQITHGDAYLSEYLPGRLKAWFGIRAKTRAARPAAPARGEATLYAAKIDPIFQRSCVSCHNPNKLKGGLRMDSYAELMKGGKGGEEIDPWHPETSELVRRITLPPDDDDHMPNNGKNPLSPAEITLIENWIAAGATATEPAARAPAQ